MESFPARYAELRLPILLQHGTADALVDIAGTRELEAGAVNAKVTTHYYDGLYHEIFNEPEQAAVLADTVAWLDSVLADRVVHAPAEPPFRAQHRPRSPSSWPSRHGA